MGCDLREARGREVRQDVQGDVGCPRGRRTFEEPSHLEEEDATIQSCSRQRRLLTVTVNQRLNFKGTAGHDSCCLDRSTVLGFQKYLISTFINPVILSAANLTQKPKAAGFESN